ncbi:SEC-C domain-containing protein [Peribacillus frigoritolerans]|uniref:SEC-C domain-containing protein n=1 Tax=Peribacillus frigoritolerans TaxID=450367 RepID=UPI000FDA6540|nr:SEC-C domain-containing protein [Peribacillus frigoritolerans]AZV62646.1 hypothetical protein DOZ91_20320 [Peribacillus frigoritolerans]
MPLNKEERMEKVDPYEPCPCGSEKNFKYCCYQQARIRRNSSINLKEYTNSRLNHEASKNWDNTDFKVCLGFDPEECRPLIKSAHAIQNNGILNRISENGHVYTISSKLSKKAMDADFKKVSKNKASTFFGFCDYHDTELFKPIEHEEYTGDPIQNFLFAFRGFCLEYHRKIRKMNSIRNIFKSYPQAMLNPSSINLYRIAEFDLSDSKTGYEAFKEVYTNGNFEDLVTLNRSLNYEVEVAISSAFAVKDDLLGKEINNIFGRETEIIPYICINIFPVQNQTTIILSYHKKYEKVYKEYFEQIKALTDSQLEKYLNFLTINYTENVFFSPRLIDVMSEREKNSLLKSFESSMQFDKRLELLKEDQFFKFNLFQQQKRQA